MRPRLEHAISGGNPLIVLATLLLMVGLARVAPALLIGLVIVAAPLLLTKAVARVGFVVLGGVATLQSSQEFDLAKAAYLVGVSITFVGAVLNCYRPGRFRRSEITRLSFVLSLVLFVVTFLTWPVSAAHGTTPLSWLRDSAPYLLLASLPILALDAQGITQRRFLSTLLLVAGTTAAASFCLEWLDRRSLSELWIGRLILPSFALTASLFAYAVAAVLQGGAKGLSANGIKWTAVASFIAAAYAVTGTRGTLIVLAAPVAALVLGNWSMVSSRARRAALYGPIGVAFTVAFGLGLSLVTGSDLAAGLARLGSVTQATKPLGSAVAVVVAQPTVRPASTPSILVGVPTVRTSGAQPTVGASVAPTSDPASVQSFNERVIQSRTALNAFLSEPWRGVGPGFVFIWTDQYGGEHRNISLDTPLSFIAKFGIVGVGALLFVLIVAGRVQMQLYRVRGWARADVARLAFGAIWLAYLPLGLPLEDKGFCLGMLLLMAPMASGSPDNRIPTMPPTESRVTKTQNLSPVITVEGKPTTGAAQLSQ
jgi:hypothetical protein